MTDLLAPLVGIAFMVGVYSIIMGRARRKGRAGWRDPIGRLGVPDSRTADMVLGLLAVGQLSLSVGQELGPREGAAVGLIGGVTMGMVVVQGVFSVVGLAAGVLGAWSFVTGSGSEGSVVWRLVFVSVVILCFALGMMFGQAFLGRSQRIFTVGNGRGLAFFGLVELVTFMASPGGADLLGLEPRRFGAYFVVAVLGAFGLGLAMGPMTLWLVACALVLVTMAFSAAYLVVYLLSGTTVFLISWAALGRRLGSG